MPCAPGTAPNATSDSAPDGNDQYVEVTNEFAHYVDDPYVDAGLPCAPLRDDVEVVVIGGGFGGLLAGVRLREAGVADVRIIEKGGDFGGTWYWNRYPGAMCDVESYIYLPLLEELGYVPTEKYARAPEILAHSQAIGRKYDLYRDACFQTEVTDLRWDDDAARWIVSTNRGDRMAARFVVMSNGPLNRPKLPGIPGIESFRGHSFHTSRWDYAYTGGDSNGGLEGLAGKRSGSSAPVRRRCSACRTSPEAAAHLYVFQRTPSVDRRAREPADRSAVGGDARPGLAPAADGQLQHPRLGRLPGRGPRQRRLDRHHPEAARHGAEGRRRRGLSRCHRAARWSSRTSRRWSRSARASTATVGDAATARR
jgi:cyclohexanone monooxygenase